MYRNLPRFAAVAVLTLMMLSSAAPAFATACMSQGESTFESCIQNMSSDGTVTSWEEGVCSRWAADMVTVCEQQREPAFPQLISCVKTWTMTVIYDPVLYPAWTLVVVFSGPLSCS